MKKKPWKEMTEKEINKLKTDQCSRCIYLSGSIGRSKTVFANRTCDYIAHHGHSRGCSPLECVEKGIFKPIKKEGRHVQK